MPADDYDQLMLDLRNWSKAAQPGDQKKLGDAMGVSAQLVSHWVTGRRRPNARNAFKLKAFLAKWRKKSAALKT
jgi:hypothetical protein